MVIPKQPNGDLSSIVEVLSRVLPKGIKFTAHHLSTPPILTEPLFHPPGFPEKLVDSDREAQGERRARKPLKTYSEKHFLAISVHTPDTNEQVLALALEIFIYTTVHTTIIFVSKADSTGYLGCLNLPKGTPSPIREITTTFISYLVAKRRRNGVQCVVNLFARAQSQYLFPGSVKNNGKHVLDDRSLVKWWCRVLSPLLEEEGQHNSGTWERIHGYLIIPGLDDYETRAFLPRIGSTAASWTLGHPLEHISPYSTDPIIYGGNVPPRCLIPTYPDDPKARFVEELEDSTPENLKLSSGWKSPRTLDQFWEMMAFRQECSSGRMTGFIWLVYDPEPSQKLSRELEPDTMPPKSTQSTHTKPPRTKKPKKKVLKGRIIPRQPQVKTHQRTHFPKLTETAHYYWPEEGRGQVVLDDSGYRRAVELLLHLEFGTLQQAVASSARWINELNSGRNWSLEIIGEREIPVDSSVDEGNMVVNDLSGAFKRKRPTTDVSAVTPAQASINSLGGGLVRKKAKVTPDSTPVSSDNVEPKVNTLGSGLVRKKAKPT